LIVSLNKILDFVDFAMLLILTYSLLHSSSLYVKNNNETSILIPPTLVYLHRDQCFSEILVISTREEALIFESTSYSLITKALKIVHGVPEIIGVVFQ